jgi:hypothetical protein
VKRGKVVVVEDLSPIPPEWVLLRLAPRYIEREFGMLATDVQSKLWRDVQARRVPHRIADMEIGLGDLCVPRGICAKPIEGNDFSSMAAVSDWSVVEVDWRAGTIWAGSRDLEVWWTAVEARYSTPIQPLGPEVGDSRRNRGGRPQKYDRMAFAREMIRVANGVDGLPERAELTRHMSDWCSAHWTEAPADSVVREWIAQLDPRET